MPTFTTEYLSAGGNRHSAAADWSVRSGVVAFGTDHNVALWRPLQDDGRGIFTLLRGHKAKVTAVHFFHPHQNGHDDEFVLSGDADGEIRRSRINTRRSWKNTSAIKAHEGAVNCISALDELQVFVTGGADAIIKIWRWGDEENIDLLSTVPTQPRFIPLCLAIGRFEGHESPDAAFLAAGGTKNDLSIYSIANLASQPQTALAASLKGHEGWIRSLSLSLKSNGDYLLASASADKYVRLWKLSKNEPTNLSTRTESKELATHQHSLTARVQKVSVLGAEYSIAFEALLLGHEDWVYSAAWSHDPDSLHLLTASADGTLSIWELDSTSGVWVSATRLGEISSQKGATTATGSSGGFWNALWSPDSRAVTCLGRTGSWRLWQYDDTLQYWVQKYAVSGHVASVNGLAWEPDGSYLLSTGSDQTTRLHVEWKRGTKRSWHEFARPQIHGYDLNCVVCTNTNQFASGADEKLLRVFDEPKSIANMLRRLCKIEPSLQANLPDTAAIPVLSLSNKSLDETNGVLDNDADANYRITALETSLEDIDEPPTEDLLSRHTLWPEHEKLYGHGYEISEAAAIESNHHLLATACKASSLDHAVIRLYDTQTWAEIKPPLTAHTLTITRLVWAPKPHEYLLSVGRDRQWALFGPYPSSTSPRREWQLLHSNSKAHTRMILDAAFTSLKGHPFFVTASRDKTVKIWAMKDSGSQFVLVHALSRKSAVTAVSVTTAPDAEAVYAAIGEEDGSISLLELRYEHDLIVIGPYELTDSTVDVPLSKAVNRLAWRPDGKHSRKEEGGGQLAIAGADGSVRIVSVDFRQENTT